MVTQKMKLIFVIVVGVFFATTMFLYFEFSKRFLSDNEVINTDYSDGDIFEGGEFLQVKTDMYLQDFYRDGIIDKSNYDVNEATALQNAIKQSVSFLESAEKKFNGQFSPSENDGDVSKNTQIIETAQGGVVMQGSEKKTNLSIDDVITVTMGDVPVRDINYLIDNKHNSNKFQSRRQTMFGSCTNYFQSSSVLKLKRDKFEHILVDEKNKMLFCYVPKVACTNWKRMFLLLLGKYNTVDEVVNIPSNVIHAKNMLASLQNYSSTDIAYFIRSYSKVIFVRNPLERLLSAYRNKFEQRYNSSKYFQVRFGKYIVKHFRMFPSQESLIKGDDVTFEEFVKYILASPKESYNEHWQSINDLCHPCFLKYDIIGKYETLLDDAKSVLNMYGVHQDFPELAKPSKTADIIAQYYNQISPDLFNKLISTYDLDFRLFGYNMPPNSMHNFV